MFFFSCGVWCVRRLRLSAATGSPAPRATLCSSSSMWMANNAALVAPRSAALSPLCVIAAGLCLALLAAITGLMLIVALVVAVLVAIGLALALCDYMGGKSWGPLLFLLGSVAFLVCVVHLHFYFFPLPPLPPGLSRQEAQETREQQVLERLQDWRLAWG